MKEKELESLISYLKDLHGYLIVKEDMEGAGYLDGAICEIQKSIELLKQKP